jgi:hypothetical protein
MKNHALATHENAAVKEVLLETIVSAHYLVLQMRILTSADEFSGNAETELMAEALSRWAQIAGTKWRDGMPEGASIPRLPQ